MLNNLQKYKILLASKSPRRRELLQQLRIPFQTIAINGIDESYPENLAAINVAQYISGIKADAYLDRIDGDELLITADTIVICENKILGKPTGREEAIEMLKLLSGKTHTVTTGVTLTTRSRRTSFTSVTEVTFSKLEEEDIIYYVDNFLPYDKAGAYGIQEWIGAVAITSINGSYYNVMGLPVNRLYQELSLF